MGLSAIVASAFCGMASPYIAAYNAAVKRADFKAAAVEAAKIWPEFDKQDPAATTIAREFAWTSMRADQRNAAAICARWLVEEGPRHTPPDDQPLTAIVLLRWAELGRSPGAKQQKALSAALAARAASSDPTDRISAIAAREAYLLAWK